VNLSHGETSELAMTRASKRRRFGLGAVALALLVGSIAMVSAAARVFALEAGARAPELGARDLAGQPVNLASLRGKVVIVDFWASWCAPCADSMPVYERLYSQLRERGLVVVGVSQDQRADNARQFAERHHLTFPVLFDEGHAIANRYHPSRMPTAFLIDRAGVVRHVHAGYRSSDAAGLEREVRALLDQPAR
jgi:cytochrome c biogenesis protein CcmG, thiol:disulfide interchange protein DsbE